jgi:dolichol kinase
MLRKLFHFSGITIPIIYLLTGRETALVGTAILFVCMGVFEVLRIRGILNISIVAKYAKAQETRRPLGSLYYVLSSFVVLAFFERNIAAASLFTLSISDPLSSIVGGRFGRCHFFGKTLEGTLTFLLSSLCIFRAFSFGTYTAVGCATIASLVELLSSRYVDDNLSIPVATAGALAILSRLF